MGTGHGVVRHEAKGQRSLIRSLCSGRGAALWAPSPGQTSGRWSGCSAGEGNTGVQAWGERPEPSLTAARGRHARDSPRSGGIAPAGAWGTSLGCLDCRHVTAATGESTPGSPRLCYPKLGHGAHSQPWLTGHTDPLLRARGRGEPSSDTASLHSLGHIPSPGQ